MAGEQLRSRTVGCKVTEEEYARLSAEAERANKSLGEWSREVLLGEAGNRPPSVPEQAVMAEVLALRTILLNLHFAVATGGTITPEQMQKFIERADEEKNRKALTRFEDAARARA
jgi:hypothetical protein